MQGLRVECHKCHHSFPINLITKHLTEAHKPYWQKMQEKRLQKEMEANNATEV